MKLEPDLLDASVQALARASAAPADGRATRARVLATAGARLQRRATGRRLALGALVALGAALSGSAAWTAVGRWRVPFQFDSSEPPPHLSRAARERSAPQVPGEGSGPSPAEPSARRPLPLRGRGTEIGLQSTSVDSGLALVTPTLDAESRAYERAHEAHFVADEPRAALAAWNRYLAAYPRGTFAPEARYNRALCLLRLGRKEAGVAALRPFARGDYGGYRRTEATTLIDWLTSSAP
jgi:TolA-binding protein